ncbi:helix-turn-helix domain-containing protein [Allomuricauda sp. SCSIO 65647]|uniref:helix-turn-helix domain-containing protein n=1 Tax=Allomuricauda sp. SCSIO 65647 TaxID=2908843 RepID=UPI001F3238DD|nr:AraC family transcriptional regulator [Muricauda sp. SCSIO 65647]UJH66398.1 AraC family transcriptional regulator [Muricauda sp. SCSIO 65647]
MNIKTFPELLGVLTGFLSFFFAFFLLTLKTKKQTSNILIAMFLIVFAIDTGGNVLLNNYVYPEHPGLGLLLSCLIFLELPFFYLYIRSIVYSDFRLKPVHIVHVVPFLLAFVVLLPNFYLVSVEEKHIVLKGEDPVLLELKLVYVILHLQVLFYLVASFVLVLHYRKLYLENHSDTRWFNHRWLFQLVLFLSVDFLVSALKNTSLFLKRPILYENIAVATNLLALGLICWIVFKALRYPELFKGINSRLQLAKQIVKKNNANHRLTEKERNLLEGLEKYMVQNEPFMNPSLSISDLAEYLQVPSKELSILINHKIHKHFFDFVNEYRIEKAKSIFQSSTDKKLTVLEVLYEVGFNSKSSFNTAFKKYTGLTPTQFRHQL